MPGEDDDNDVRAAFDDDTDLTTERAPVIRRREVTMAPLDEPKTVRRRTGRTLWTGRVVIAALVGYGLGLITPTPEGAEISGDEQRDETRIELEWGDQRIVIDNPGDLSQAELNDIVNQLIEAAEAANADTPAG